MKIIQKILCLTQAWGKFDNKCEIYLCTIMDLLDTVVHQFLLPLLIHKYGIKYREPNLDEICNLSMVYILPCGVKLSVLIITYIVVHNCLCIIVNFNFTQLPIVISNSSLNLETSQNGLTSMTDLLPSVLYVITFSYCI